jgi:hypothetical protein
MHGRRLTGRASLNLAWTAAVMLVAAIWILDPSAARAGAYTAWSCRNGSNGSTEGIPDWIHSSFGVGYFNSPGIVCQALPPATENSPFSTAVLVDGRNDPAVVTDDMTVTAPPGIALSRARLWWRGDAASNGQVAALATHPDRVPTVLVDRRGAAFPISGDPNTDAAANDVLDLGSASGLTLRSACLSACQTAAVDGATAEWFAYRVALTAVDETAPSGGASGSLVTDRVLSGIESVRVDGSDVGGGVYLARVVVDGQVVMSASFAGPPCQDVDTNNGDPFEFGRLHPCPGSATASMAVDASTLGEDALHDVAVQVVDAAGNTTTVAQRRVGVDAVPPSPGWFTVATRRFENPLFDIAAARQSNGQPALPGARLRIYLPVRRAVRTRRGTHGAQRRHVVRAAMRRTVSFGSHTTLRAVLTGTAGEPIVGARLWTAARESRRDWEITGPSHVTSTSGRVGFRLPSSTPSRQLNLLYFPYSDTHDQTVGRPVVLRVRAGVHLNVDTGAVRNGQRIRFSGRIDGLDPGAGVTASLQVKQRSRYRTFRQISARAADGGRFFTAYRFVATARVTRYRFRVVVLKQAGLRFEGGVSRVRTVLVQP